MGFDWPGGYEAVAARPVFDGFLTIAYYSLFPQIVGSIFYFAFLERNDRNAELLSTCMLSLVLTTLIWGIFPAVSACVYFERPAPDSLPDVLALRDGSASVFTLGQMKGIITLPSYHTVLGLLLVYAYRGLGRSYYLMMALNGVMLLSIPSVGCHYLVDMVAGVLVAALSIAAVRCAKGWQGNVLRPRSRRAGAVAPAGEVGLDAAQRNPGEPLDSLGV